MTIKKILSIKNIGRFVNSGQKGPELNRQNLIFAENGRGKTTLCAVLRSLETGDSGHIIARKTISSVSGDPEVTIRLDGSNAKYSGGAWNTSVPEIAIFDATFVAENVHAGEFVSRDHRSNLLQVIVGEKGIKFATDVSDLDSGIRAKNSEIVAARKAVQAHVPPNVKIETFLQLKKESDADAKIAVKEAELKTAKEADTVKTRASLTVVEIPAIPEELVSLLTTTLDDVASDVDKRLKEQIEYHNMHENGEAWLSEGLSYVQDDNCPFCGQNLKESELVAAYKQYFSESYAALKEKIKQAKKDLDSTLGDAIIAALGRTIAKNDAGKEFWGNHVQIELDTIDHDSLIVARASTLHGIADSLIAKKLASPLESVAATEDFDTALSDFELVKVGLGEYNKKVELANGLIESKKKEALDADAKSIESRLIVLKLGKKRHEPKVSALCDDYTNLAAEKEKLDKDKKTAKAALDAHADKMMGDFESTINDLLQGFGAGFAIVGSKKSYVGGTPVSEYKILINSHPVELGDASTPHDQACFRTTLSAGDKSTLALAFFLAKLDHDPNKANQIIVFDDPFNSQDRSRRERTAELLKQYASKCKQLILLSHDPHFLLLVHNKLPKAERHCLQLSRVPDNNTTIEEWDIKKETQGGYFKDHAALHSYLLSGGNDLLDIVRKIRPVLEGYLRYRFPNRFPDNDWLGDMIKAIRDEGPAHPMHLALEDLEGINDYSKKYHHETNPGKADSEPINDGELSAYAKRTLNIAGGY